MTFTPDAEVTNCFSVWLAFVCKQILAF